MCGAGALARVTASTSHTLHSDVKAIFVRGWDVRG